jgi:hypothetical protein
MGVRRRACFAVGGTFSIQGHHTGRLADSCKSGLSQDGSDTRCIVKGGVLAPSDIEDVYGGNPWKNLGIILACDEAHGTLFEMMHWKCGILRATVLSTVPQKIHVN